MKKIKWLDKLNEKDVNKIDAYLKKLRNEEKFIKKNHTTRVEKFEPPFELRKGETYDFCVNSYDGYRYIKNEYGYKVYNHNDTCYGSFKTYQEAVDYAHKLFKGEE